MEHYERFTKRDEKGNVYYPHCFERCGGFTDTERCINCDYYDRLLNKFAYLEELESKGLLLVLPCKVGDIVYVLEPCHCYNNYKETQNCHRAKTKATKYIDIVRVPKKYNGRSNTNCVKLYERPFKIDYLTKIGKTVFLTKEEAEQKLESMKGE